MKDNTIFDPIKTFYIGKNKFLHFTVFKPLEAERVIARTLHYSDRKPKIIDSIFNEMRSNSQVLKILDDQYMTVNQIELHFRFVRNDPVVLNEYINDGAKRLNYLNAPLLLGLSTTNPFGYFIVAIVMALVLVIIGLLIATLRIITCLNPDGCFEKFMQNLLDNFIQELTPR